MTEQFPDLFTYRGRTLDELVARIREDLGDDAVIVARRETRTGGFAGFFARREIEVDVRPPLAAGEAPQRERPAMLDPDESPAARAFREQLALAEERSAGHDVVSDEPAVPQTASDVDVDDLFPGRPDPSGYGAVFDLRTARTEAEVIPIGTAAAVPAPAGAERYERDLDAIVHADLPLDEEAPSAPAAGPVEAPPLADGPVTVHRLTLPPTLAPVACAPGEAGPQAAAIADRIVERMTDRGLDEELARRAAAEAVAALLPFEPEADVRELVARTLATRLPVAPLRTGAATCAFVGSGGSGKTRTVARLAAAYERSGDLPVTVVALRPGDDGEELQRLLAPYDVQLLTAENGDDAADALAGGGMVFVDTPAIVLRDRAGIDRLLADLRALGADEIHATLPATMSAQAAGELLDVLGPAGLTAIVVTHCDETFQLGTMIGLSAERNLPISYVGHGQAVDAGLAPIASEALAAELLC